MDQKDKKIQDLEKEVTRLKKIMATFEKQLKLVNARMVRSNEVIRRIDANSQKALSGVEQLKQIIGRG